MRTLCDKCNCEINTNGGKKGEYAYSYEIQVDNEPNVSTAFPKTHKGYLCCECSKKVFNVINSKY